MTTKTVKDPLAHVRRVAFMDEMARAIMNTSMGPDPRPIDPAEPFKCVTRRLVTERQMHGRDRHTPFGVDGDWRPVQLPGFPRSWSDKHACLIWCADYAPGDILCVGEGMKRATKRAIGPAWFSADNSVVLCGGEAVMWQWTNKGLPGRYMRKVYARTFMRVTDVRPERLQAIDDADALREGIARQGQECVLTPWERFTDLWDGLHKDPPFDWASSPWVWRIAFERITKEEATNG